MSTTHLARRRGRPPAHQPAARNQILDALVRLLDDQPLARPSLRAVAHAARVTPALMHYHFDDLPGLMRCLHAERALPLLRPLLRDLQSGQPSAGAALARFLHKWTALGLRHPWLAACLLQPPALPQNPDDECCGIVRAAVIEAQRQGAVRGDLPDSYIALLLLSLGAMPHLAQTTLAAGIDQKALADAEGAAALTLQHLSVLQAGVARSAAAP